MARTRSFTLPIVFALAACALGYVLYQRGFFHRHTPKVVRVREGESPVLPRRSYSSSPALEVGIEHLTMNVRRSWLYVAPKNPLPDREYPLVFVLHGDGGDGPGFHEATPFEQASGDSAILIYPSGRNATWDIETAVGNEDRAFLEAALRTMQTRYRIDRTRVFGTGYSSGAYFLNFTACERPGFFRAIASNAGSAPYKRDTTYPNGYTKCSGQKPIPMLALHGDKDYTVTVQSGRFSADYWGYVNGCNASTVETTGYPECQAFLDCEGHNDVAFCLIPGLGHWVWERHAEATWTFFRLHGAELEPAPVGR